MLLDSRLALQKSYLPIKNLQPAMSWYLRKEWRKGGRGEMEGKGEDRKGKKEE